MKSRQKLSIIGVLFLSFFLMIFASGCTSDSQTADKSGDNETLETEYTTAFSVEYLDNGVKKLVDADNRTLLLVPEGTEVPEGYEDAIIIASPVDNVMLASTTQGCMMRGIDDFDAISAVTTEQSAWTINEIADRIGQGSISFVGDNDAPDYELIKTLNPSLVFVYSGDYGLQDMMTKLDELGINYVVCNEYLEEDPRGRMEWLKFYGAIFDKEEEAQVTFDKAMANIDTVVEEASKEEAPTVAWGMVSSGKVYVAKPDSYVAKMIELAGGDYIYKDADVGSGTVTMEEFYAAAKDADILIYSSGITYSPDIASVLSNAPVLEGLNAVQNGRVWCLGTDYWQSLDKTDGIIEDLYAIFHGDGTVTHFVKY
ncbi:MAG: cobalamin transport system substrate-binding protein [Eubacteriaceae bacterium]|nr:cobalamin transport system substrate-binding protein [Eubacteriaceae bacterium]